MVGRERGQEDRGGISRWSIALIYDSRTVISRVSSPGRAYSQLVKVKATKDTKAAITRHFLFVTLPLSFPPLSVRDPSEYLAHLLYVLDALEDVYPPEKFILTWCGATEKEHSMEHVKKVRERERERGRGGRCHIYDDAFLPYPSLSPSLAPSLSRSSPSTSHLFLSFRET